MVVAEQEEPDYTFKTVGYPNPEDPKAFGYAIELGKKEKADILVATDPDCDRVAMMVNDGNDNFVFLNGNQIGALLVNYILSQRHKKEPCQRRGAIVRVW